MAFREVVIDARWLRTGIGRYILTLLKELKPKLSDMTLTCITMRAHASALEPYCDRVIEMNCGIYSLAEQILLPFTARDAAVFCVPHYNVPALRRGPVVVTIHDLTHLQFPAYRRRLPTSIYANAMLRIASTRGTHIIAPSHYTRTCLIEHLGTDPNKISVIPCAISEVFRVQPKEESAEAVRTRHGITGPYLLFVGSTAPHKNLTTFLKAYQLFSARRRDKLQVVLVLPRKAAARQDDRGLAPLLEGPVHCLYSVSDESLASLYGAAVMTVMPSFEEGFGLPVVESMACGTPVACSCAASLPEIAGDSAIYFDPNSAEDLAWVMDRLLNSETLRRDLTERGLQRAATFPATRAAAAYAAVLSAVVGDRTVDAIPVRQHHGL